MFPQIQGGRSSLQRVFTLHSNNYRYLYHEKSSFLLKHYSNSESRANALRTHFDQNLLNNKEQQKRNDITWFANYEGVFLSHWYSALYVVIEGWKALQLADKEIDSLLDTTNVDLLRKFRNGVCHFQPYYLDIRFVGFMAEPSTVEWVRKLNREFGRYFLETFNKHSTDN